LERRRRWGERLGEELSCARCGTMHDSTDLDRMLWCEDCVAQTRALAGRAGTGIGVTVGGLAAAWIWLVIKPSPALIPGAWIATVVAAGWLAARLGRELVFGLIRVRE